MEIRGVNIPVEGLALHGSPYVVDGGVYQALINVEHQILTYVTVEELYTSLVLWQSSGWRASGGITWDGSLYHLLLVKET